jgi:hypothetical protein
MGFWRLIKRARDKDKYKDGDKERNKDKELEERFVETALMILSSHAQTLVNELIKRNFSKYIDLYKAVFGFESQQVKFLSAEAFEIVSRAASSLRELGYSPDSYVLGEIYNIASRAFEIKSSIVEPNYSSDNYLVRAFNRFFNIDKNSYPIQVEGSIACTVGLAPSTPSMLVGTMASGNTLLVNNGAEIINDRDMGQVTCNKIARIIFSSVAPREVNADAANLFRAAVDVINNVRNRFSNLREDFVNTYDFEPANIGLGLGNSVMLYTSFDLNMSSTVRDKIQELFAIFVPGKKPVQLTLGIMCGVPPRYLFGYDTTDETLHIGHPKVGSRDCVKNAIINYV